MNDFFNDYTGREIAIFTDIHALLEPTIAILDDIRKRGIKEIYSLGDAIGVGPNPSQVLDILGENGVIQINGNSEEYCILGLDSFASDFKFPWKRENQEWTYLKLTSDQLKTLKENKHSYDLIVGGETIGLCHFANDIRIDFTKNNTYTYQKSINKGIDNPNEQFYYTNSYKQKKNIEKRALRNEERDQGFVSAKNDPIFSGKTIDCYDEIIQGHVHFRYLTEDFKSKVRTIRGAGIGYGNDPVDIASYIIIKERKIGYDVIEVPVMYNRDKMLMSIDQSNIPYPNLINKYVSRKR